MALLAHVLWSRQKRQAPVRDAGRTGSLNEMQRVPDGSKGDWENRCVAGWEVGYQARSSF